MTQKRVSYLVQIVLFCVLFVLVGCRNEEPSSSLYFPKYDLVDGEWVRMPGIVGGELVKTGDCLRLIVAPTNTSYLVVWPPGYELDERDNDILIRDDSGQVVTRVGENVYMGGGDVAARENVNPTLDGVPGVSEQLVAEIENSGCPGPYWFSGGVILDNNDSSSSLYFPKYGLVDGEWAALTSEIKGELVRSGDCLRLIAISSNTSYLVVWPPGYEVDEEGSEILIRDTSGQVVARVGEEVFMGGGGRQRETFDGVPGVSEQLAAEIKNSGCPGPYWFSGGVILDRDE